MEVKALDFFAAFAMQSLIVSDDIISTQAERDKIAKLSYDMAEAMVAQSAGRPGESLRMTFHTTSSGGASG